MHHILPITISFPLWVPVAFYAFYRITKHVIAFHRTTK